MVSSTGEALVVFNAHEKPPSPPHHPPPPLTGTIASQKRKVILLPNVTCYLNSKELWSTWTHKFYCKLIVQFQVRYDRWIKEVITHFYRLSLHLKQYIHKFQREKDLVITLLLCVFTWRHGGHICVPKQWNGGHVCVPNQSCGSWTLFVCKRFLLFQYICIDAGHVSESTELYECVVNVCIQR